MFLLQFVKNFVVYLWGFFLVFLMASPKYIYNTSVRSKKLKKNNNNALVGGKEDYDKDIAFSLFRTQERIPTAYHSIKIKSFQRNINEMLTSFICKEIIICRSNLFSVIVMSIMYNK